MGIWIRVFATETIDLDVGQIREAMARRLGLLTALACPDDEEDGDEVLDRLQVKPEGENEASLFCRTDPTWFIPGSRWLGESAREEVGEQRKMLPANAPGVESVQELLERNVETLAFELKASDAEGHGLAHRAGRDAFCRTVTAD